MERFDVIVLGAGAAGLAATQPMVIDRPCGLRDAAGQLMLEQALFDAPTLYPQQLRLWQPLPALIATRAEANHPEFRRAAARAAGRGLAVAVRASGGGAVCLGPGSLVVSFFHGSAGDDIDASYRRLADVLIDAAATLDASLTLEHVHGAYCDGRFDLAWKGLKVGGFAQRRRVHAGGSMVWVHAVLAVGAEALGYPASVSEFYADLGSSRIADINHTTTLWHCLSGRRARRDLMSRIGDAIVKVFNSRVAGGACSLHPVSSGID